MKLHVNTRTPDFKQTVESMNASQTTSDEKNKKGIASITGLSKTASWWLIFGFIWGMAGLVAVVTSVVCVANKGTVFQKVAGILMAMFLGPLYFLFPTWSKTYCKPR